MKKTKQETKELEAIREAIVAMKMAIWRLEKILKK